MGNVDSAHEKNFADAMLEGVQINFNSSFGW
jgi:hypothetical protein